MKENPKIPSTLSSCIKSSERVEKCPVANRTDYAFAVETVKDDKTGKIVRKSSYKAIDRIAEMKHYKVSDFSLENLLAIGASLQPCPLLTGNRFVSIHNLENTMSNISKTE